jgi:hypothetical protein
MSGRFFKIICAAVLSIGLVGQANAVLIVGKNYTDNDSVLWEYVGSYDMFTGPAWDGTDSTTTSDNATPYNGLEAAVAAGIASGSLANLAIAAFDQNFSFQSVMAGDEIVNHMAWYDGAVGAITMFSEDIVADGNADGKYTRDYSSGVQTDRSAWVDDRVAQSGVYVNYVFQRATEVPAPSTLVIFVLALCAIGARKFKR